VAADSIRQAIHLYWAWRMKSAATKEARLHRQRRRSDGQVSVISTIHLNLKAAVSNDHRFFVPVAANSIRQAIHLYWAWRIKSAATKEARFHRQRRRSDGQVSVISTIHVNPKAAVSNDRRFFVPVATDFIRQAIHLCWAWRIKSAATIRKNNRASCEARLFRKIR